MRSIMEGMKIGTLSIVTFGTAIVYTVRKHPNTQCIPNHDVSWCRS